MRQMTEDTETSKPIRLEHDGDVAVIILEIAPREPVRRDVFRG